MNKNYIFFDFDGVIVDSFKPAFEANKTICPHVTEEDYKKRFEGNINDKVPTNIHAPECRLDLNFFDIYLPKMQEVAVVPGMPEVIKKLAADYTLIVISSTITSPIEELLTKTDLIKYFVQVMGNDVHKSKVEKIKMVFDKYQTTAESCIFVTDTLGDMREASKMNVSSIGVIWGFHTSETLNQGNPFRLVEKPEDIVTAVKGYFSK